MKPENPLEQRYNYNQARRNVRLLIVSMVVLSMIIIGGLGYILSSELNRLSDRMTAQNSAISEGNELITCLLALHDPENFPGADSEKCRERVKTTNNTDGTFFVTPATIAPGTSQRADQAPVPVQGPRGATGPQGPQGEPGQPRVGPVQEILDSVGNIIGGI